MVERAAKDRASRSIALLYRLMPKKVRVLTATGERFVSIDALTAGQVFLVKAGERFPPMASSSTARLTLTNRC